MANEEIDILNEEQELYEHHRIVCDPKQSLLRLDKFLFDRLANTSRNRIQVAAKAGNVLVNGKVAKPSQKVKPGDVISVVLPYPQREVELVPEDIPALLETRDRRLTGPTMPPQGLYMHRVWYEGPAGLLMRKDTEDIEKPNFF